MGSRFFLGIALEAIASASDTPLYQSTAAGRAASPVDITLKDSSRDDRWFGLGVWDVRWALDGSAVYFRWNLSPSPSDVPEADPWYRADRSGKTAERVRDEDAHAIPTESPSWSSDGTRACWTREGSF